ncbi:MAG: DNA-3-methyladenine glycosylase [Bacteroidota bacterium]
MKKLPRSFYSRKTVTVAKELLGKIIVRRIGKTLLSGIIVETEAYLFNDPASHSFRGMTKRNEVMFGEPGFLYVYFTYGMHYCANVVTNIAGVGEAVLIRAVEPMDGLAVMMKNRKRTNNNVVQKDLTNGPAKFAQAFGLTTNDSGTDLGSDELFIAEGIEIPRSQILTTTRIGISVAKDYSGHDRILSGTFG